MFCDSVANFYNLLSANILNLLKHSLSMCELFDVRMIKFTHSSCRVSALTSLCPNIDAP